MNAEYLTFVTYTNSYGEQITECENITNVAVTDNKDSCDNPYRFGYAMGFEGKDFRCPYECFSSDFFWYERGYDEGKSKLEKVAE